MQTSNDLTLPWLNNIFLEAALRSSEEESLQVTSYEVAHATAPGDHYSSQMLRVNVHFTRGGQSDTRSIILKTELSTDIAKISAEANFFQKEGTVLTEIVPKIHSLIQEVSPEKIPPFAAECLYSHIGPPAEVIVLEDLKVGGFRMAERTEGLDMDHCLLVLRTLAKYHAASVVQYKQDPESLKILHEQVYSEEWVTEVFESVFGNSLKSLVKEMENWREFDRFSKQLKKVSEVAVPYLFQCMTKQDCDFNVLSHGDLWTNNMMFRYSDTTGQVQEIRFLDFPNGNIVNAALDLQYFLHTSPSMELLDRYHILLEEYHKELGNTFALLGCEQFHPTFQQLMKQTNKLGLYAVIIACSVLPIVLSDRTDLPDLDKLMKNEQGIRYSQRYKNALKLLFPIFEEKGWLNVENYHVI